MTNKTVKRGLISWEDHVKNQESMNEWRSEVGPLDTKGWISYEKWLKVQEKSNKTVKFGGGV